jgi:hypothetical protein
MLWVELAVSRVCIATDRQNKSIITIKNQQLIKPVCCSASHRQRYWESFGWIECQGCEREHSFECSAEDKSEWSCNSTDV